MIEIISALVCLIWLFQAEDIVRGILFRTPVLKAGPRAVPQPAPKISIIFSARNESANVRPALESMLGLDYPDYEVIAVNDRSEDETYAVLKSFHDPKLQVLNILELPEGWLGKNHALFEAYRHSTGSWLLFTDADVHFHRDTLKASVEMIQEKNLDHLVVFPDMICGKWIEKIFCSAFILAFFRRFRPWKALDPESENFIGVGAFNMVRRETYRGAGTHQKIAMDVLDDIHLGRMIKVFGGRQMGVCGPELVKVRWAVGWEGVLKSLEKNAFAGFDYSAPLLVLATFAGILLDVLPFPALFFPKTFLPAMVAVFCIAAAYAAGSRINRGTWVSFFLHPLGMLLILALMWRSALKVLSEGGVTWRGTFYPLDQLRAYSKK